MSKTPAVAEAGRVVAQKTDSRRMEPWFDDGNIVLAMEGYHFRVHRGILSTYSEVFKDMFDFLPPKHSDGVHEEQECVDQCPVVPLYDEPADMQMVLKAMYDRRYPLQSGNSDKVPLSIVSVFLRLGDKYIIPAFVQDAKARLRCGFKVTLSTAAQISSHSGGSLQLFPGIVESDPHNFQVMNVLREIGMGTPLLLPMYQCAVTCPTATVADGYELDGSVCFLSSANLRSYIFVKDILDNLRVRLFQQLRKSKACSCFMRALDIPEYSGEMAAPSQPLVRRKQEWNRIFCSMCQSDLKSQRREAIKGAWNQIPAALSFGTWEEAFGKND